MSGSLVKVVFTLMLNLKYWPVVNEINLRLGLIIIVDYHSIKLRVTCIFIFIVYVITSPSSNVPESGDAVLVLIWLRLSNAVTVSSFTKAVSGSSLRATTSLPFGSLAVALIKLDTLPVFTAADLVYRTL